MIVCMRILSVCSHFGFKWVPGGTRGPWRHAPNRRWRLRVAAGSARRWRRTTARRRLRRRSGSACSDATARQQIFDEGVANFTRVKAQIHKVTLASVLGAKMRGAAATMLKVEDFSAQVDAAIELLRQKTAVTDEEISKIKDTHAELKYPTQNIATQHTFTQRLYPKDPSNIYSKAFTQRLYPTYLYQKDLYPKPPPSKHHPKDSTQKAFTQRPLPLRPYPKETYHKDFSPTTLT